MWKFILFSIGLCLPFSLTFAQDRGSAKLVERVVPNNPKGVVLVIGNWTYLDDPLKNPQNDAEDITKIFEDLGYVVLHYKNLKKEDMDKAHSEFIDLLSKYKVGIFYFAGHGFESERSNTHYLNSIEVRKFHTLNQSIEKSLNLATIWADMVHVNPQGTNLLFIDACRTFKDRSWSRNGTYQGTKVDAPKGTVAFFAASPGQPASENSSQRNGLFTQELKKQLLEPNLEIYDVIRNTANEVFKKNSAQEPYWSGNLYGKFYFNAKVIPPTPLDSSEIQKRFALLEEENRKLREATKNLVELDKKKKFSDLPFSEMVFVEGGTFEMGSNQGDQDAQDNEMVNGKKHTVTVGNFWMGKYEVTQAQWRAIMGRNPPELYNKNCDDCPVEGVSWNDIQDFLKKLNALRPGENYRLPTEAEWEYAARGGKHWKDGYTYAGSNDLKSVGWFYDNYSESKHGAIGTTHPVGKKAPNALGLHDMSGNVWEWCSDWYGEDWYSQTAASQPNPENKNFGPKQYRVLRGGSWISTPNFERVAYRNRLTRAFRGNDYGFRVVVSQVQ